MTGANAPAPTPHPPDAAENDAVAVVYQFVRGLLGCYRRVQKSSRPGGLDPATVGEQLTSLLLAESAIRLARPAERPRQLAVIGPTQVGKSTIVNLLLGRAVAEVSPLAGFTAHPQGVWVAPNEADAAWAKDLFPGWRQCAPDQLCRDDLNAYALSSIDPPSALTSAPQGASSPTHLPAGVFWDTPDFDSLCAGEYQRGVLEVAALADAYLLVLSKEKYSDLSVWKMLRLLEPLGRPLAVVLNKVTPDSAEVVVCSLRQRLAEFGRAWGDVPIVPIDYCPQLAAAAAPDAHAVLGQIGAGPLVETVGQRLESARRPGAGLRALVQRHWDTWTAPLRAEHAVADRWQRQIDAGLQTFLDRYRRDYLDHPHRYDAFRRAALELLQLLEIPKLGGWITKARQAATWPVRQLWDGARAWRAARRGADARPQHFSAESAVLADGVDELLTALQRDWARRCDPAAPGFAMGRAIGRRLRDDEPRLRATFHAALDAHHAEVTREVQAAASELYEQLRAQPVRLAALRAARAAVDAGALLLAVKTGGLTPVDALWAPASFALSSLLVEGFAGVQMSGVARGLKKRQYERVEQTLVQRVLARELRDLADNLDDEGLFGVTVERLEAAGRALRTWEQQDDG